MADYYPLLARAVSALPDSTAETRRSIYERARKALLGQLRAIDPPISESDIARESSALDESIARLEAEIAGKAAAAAAEAAVTAAMAEALLPEPPKVEPPKVDATKADATKADTAKLDTAKLEPAKGGAPAQAETPKSGGAAAADQPAPEAKAPEPRAPRAKPFSFRAPEAKKTEPPAAPEPAPSEPAPAEAAPSEAAPPSDTPPSIDLKPPRPREAARPAAPTPQDSSGGGKRIWILGGVAAGVVLLVAGLAIKLKGRPEDLAQFRPTPPAQTEQQQSGKISGRIGAPGAPAEAPARPATPGQQQTAPTQPPVPVAHRAALLLEAPDTEEKVKTFIGSVVWRLDNVNGAPGQPLGTAVHADVDVPEAKIRMSIDLQKNTDATLPASHTVEVRFTLLPGSEIPGVKQISSVQMRREDSPNGEPLAGVPVQITDTYFLIGLARGDMETRNLDLLKTRGWLDLPLALTNGKIAKFTLEKGVSGDRVINDAIANWQQK